MLGFQQLLALLCHIGEVPRQLSSRASPGVSLQNAAADGVQGAWGPPSPRRVGPRRVFCVRWNTRVYALARELIARATASDVPVRLTELLRELTRTASARGRTRRPSPSRHRSGAAIPRGPPR